MTREQYGADRWIEWAILVLGLAGVVAIFVPFAGGLSPLQGLILFTGGHVDGIGLDFDSVFQKIELVAGLGPFFLPPVIGALQLARCVGRPPGTTVSRLVRRVEVAALLGLVLLAVAALRSIVADWRTIERAEMAGTIVTVLMPIIVWKFWRSFDRRMGAAVPGSLAIPAYVGCVIAWSAIFIRYLDDSAAFAGFACVVYAGSLWRQIGQAKA